VLLGGRRNQAGSGEQRNITENRLQRLAGFGVNWLYIAEKRKASD